MVKNQIIRIDNDQKMQSIICKAINEGINVVEIDGIKIQSEEDYLVAIETGFNLPYELQNNTPTRKNLYTFALRYMGFVRWDGWVGISGHMLVIYNYAEFMKGDVKLKKDIINSFAENILPFWEQGGELCANDGDICSGDDAVIEYVKVRARERAKPFNVYLVD